MKRWLFIVALVVSAGAGLMIGVVGLASRDLAVPPDTSDLVLERVEVADKDNAYTHFNAAVEAIDWPEDGTAEERLIGPIVRGEEHDAAFVDGLLARNTRALGLLKRGLDCEICQPPPTTRVSDLQSCFSWRDLADLLELKAIREQERREYSEAVQSCCDMLRFGELAQNDSVDLVNYLTGVGFLQRGARRAVRLATSSDIASDDLVRLADALAPVQSLDHGLVCAFRAEYWITAGHVDDAQAKYGKSSGYTFHPNKTKCALADLYRERIANAPRVLAELDLCDPTIVYHRHEGRMATALGVNYIGKMHYDMFAGEGDMMMEFKCRNECLLAAARLVVACRRYEMDHGELPPTLEALVPKYLDTVPRDPFDGKPFRYVRDKAIVYAVGTDLVDSGGSDKLTRNEPMDNEWQRMWSSEDAVLHIHRQPEKTN